jgi:GntR family transcriptional regulator
MTDRLPATPEPVAHFHEDEKIDKKNYVPAYVQLAQILRQRIATNVYGPGARLPSESVIAKNFGISAMTARQAIGILHEEGLIDRVQGSGTFVRQLQFTSSSFGLDSLRRVFIKKDQLESSIINASVSPASEDLAAILQLGTGLLLENNIFSFKKAELQLLPESLNQREAGFLQLEKGKNVFKLTHTYFAVDNLPSAYGWFLIAPEQMPLICRMGVWND